MAERSRWRPGPGASALVLLALCAGAPGEGAAQENCEWLPPTEDVTSRDFGASRLITARRPHLRCADGIRLRADSARHFENADFFQLFGNALFESDEELLEADLIRYWRNEGRMEARGDARLTRLADGSVITGEDLDLLQAGERRDTDRLTATGGRPRIVFHPGAAPDPGAPPAAAPDTSGAPWDIVGDRIFIEGRSYLVASGSVEARRDSLEAYGGTLEFDDPNDRLLLRGEARMVNAGYDLEGDSILGHVVDDVIRSLTAFDDALLVGEDLRLAAPRIRIETPEGALERVVAVVSRAPAQGPPGLEVPSGAVAPDTADVLAMEHPPRPVARTEDFVMVADSIDVHAPGEALERLIAVGRARGESTTRDSLDTPGMPDVARRDWIDGDTIIAHFAPVAGEAVADDPPADEAVRPAAPDTAAGDDGRGEYRLEELIARVNARSLYRMAPADSAEARSPEGTVRLAVHYVTGREIRIGFTDGEVRLMEVVGPAQGVHLEPFGGTEPSDTAAAADTAAVPDTSVVGDTATAPAAAPGGGEARAPGPHGSGGVGDDRPLRGSVPRARPGTLRPLRRRISPVAVRRHRRGAS